jgi:hypothetical protein
MSTAIDTTTTTDPVIAALAAVRAELRIPETYPHEAIADVCGGEDSDLARAVYERLSRPVIAWAVEEPRTALYHLWGEAAEVVDSWLGDGTLRCAEELDLLFAGAETMPAPTQRPEICERCSGCGGFNETGDPQDDLPCPECFEAGYRLVRWEPWPTAELELVPYIIGQDESVRIDGAVVGERIAEDALGQWGTSARTRTTTVATDEGALVERLHQIWSEA